MLQSKSEYLSESESCGSLTCQTRTQGPIGEAIGELSDCLNTVRHYMRILGKAASVPIEPEEQTRLLDGCSQLPGIIGGGVPGGECATSIAAI